MKILIPKRAKIKEEDEEEEEETMRFDDPDPEKHDVVLVVKGQKFYCCKSTLAKQSKKLDAMFFGEPAEDNVKELELYDPQSAEEFQSFLELIHGVKCLNDENAPGLLRLCLLWVAGIAINRCIDYLVSYDCELPMKEKFNLAYETDQKKLMALLLPEITTSAHLNSLITDDVYKSNKSIIVMLLKKSVDLSVEALQQSVIPRPHGQLNNYEPLSGNPTVTVMLPKYPQNPASERLRRALKDV